MTKNPACIILKIWKGLDSRTPCRPCNILMPTSLFRRIIYEFVKLWISMMTISRMMPWPKSVHWSELRGLIRDKNFLWLILNRVLIWSVLIGTSTGYSDELNNLKACTRSCEFDNVRSGDEEQCYEEIEFEIEIEVLLLFFLFIQMKS